MTLKRARAAGGGATHTTPIQQEMWVQTVNDRSQKGAHMKVW